MIKKQIWIMTVVIALVVLLVEMAKAVTITHGSMTIDLEFVTVGNPGNAGELSGSGAGGYGPDRICGAVDYIYNIGKYEVTADHWAQVIAVDPNVGNAGEWSGSQPTAGTSWHEAAKFCNWLTTGNANSGYYTIVDGLATPNALRHDAYAALYGMTYFIPTEDEWYKAAYYDGSAGIYYDYPTGSNSVPDGIDFYGDSSFDVVFNDGYEQVYPNAVTNVGVASPYGTVGQGGNVWERNETAIGLARGLRGGVWAGNSSILLNSFRDDYGFPTYEVSGIGFRVAMIPEPSSIIMLITGVLGLIVYAKQRRNLAA
jgi:formylglycine-generating enzyme